MQTLLKTIRQVLITIGVLLSFFAVLEIIQAYQALYALHPYAAYTFAVILAGLSGWVLFNLIRVSSANPPPLRPPDNPPDENSSPAELRASAQFLSRVVQRLRQNSRLDAAHTEALKSASLSLTESLSSIRDETTLRKCVEATSTDIIQPAIDSLDRAAEKEVQECVRDIMLAVTLSPWRSVDMMVVLYRNFTMVTRVIGIYNTRPPWREQWLIYRDILAVVATVNFLHYGNRLLQNLIGGAPMLGRFADDVAQGVGAGFLTSVTGHAAIDRCHAVRNWNRTQAREDIAGRLTTFLADIRDIVISTVLPGLRKPVEAQLPEGEDRQQAFEKLSQAAVAAIDQTSDVVDAIILQPGRTAGHTVFAGVKTAAKTTGQAGAGIGRGVSFGARGVAKVTKSGFGLIARPFKRSKKPHETMPPVPGEGD